MNSISCDECNNIGAGHHSGAHLLHCGFGCVDNMESSETQIGKCILFFLS